MRETLCICGGPRIVESSRSLSYECHTITAIACPGAESVNWLSHMATKEKKTRQGQLGDPPIECQCEEWNSCRKCHAIALLAELSLPVATHKLLTLD